jgi:hypothetical protein
MSALQEFTVTLTLCFTPEHLGEAKHHTSPPHRAGDFADFAEWAVARYAAPAGSRAQSAVSTDQLKHSFKELSLSKSIRPV